MKAEDLKELINTVFEGLLGLAGLVLAAWLINGHPGDTVIVAFANTIAVSILVFFFGQRGSAKAVNGNITALSNIASNLILTSQSNTRPDSVAAAAPRAATAAIPEPPPTT